ncbi:methyl-accepting chemotaxis protein [Billgrantia bachuensis]|uniref:HAMP domain-containing protein n=1 Tax=Billgrantia bachuensis TaxID=2717286 RepID=A0ABX0PU58_9GAMM|nr:methyl-accepting chemotaxis protein [Halomonas bachuensis]NIC06795.1 HAMP domain-containing protein [Halomonas bachuensis]
MRNNFMNKIRVKYAVAFIGVALSLLVVVIADLLLVHSVRDRMTEFSGTFNAAISAVLNADRDLYQARIAELEYLQAPTGSEQAQALQEDYEENAQQAYDRMHEFTQLLDAYPEITGRLDGFESLFSQWSDQSSEVLELHASGNTDAAREQLEGASLTAFNQLRDVYNEAGELADAKVVELEALTLARIRAQQFSVLGFSLLVFLAAVAIALIGPMLMSRAIRQITGRIREITEGDGDLTARIESRRKDELGELAEQFNAFILRIDKTLQTVRSSTLSVHNASSEITKSSQDLSSRTEQTAANLQETSASMEEITATVSNTSDATQQANQLVQETVGVARRGQEAMTQVESTMDDISRSAAQINEFIGLIDGITFQTNILALNASVEAARAGEHGRGFAVVAQEVRTLASRSSDASRGIRELIDTSVSRTQSGASLVKSTGKTMQEVVASIERITGVIGEISAGAKEQSQGIAQVNIAVSELDNMTQHNASLVEQTSAAADEMREQVERLNELIASFRLSDSNDTEQTLLPAPTTSKREHTTACGRQTALTVAGSF